MLGNAIYNIGIRSYRAGVGLAAATGNAKAKLWIDGRRHWRERMKEHLKGTGPLIWVHAASLGEFEQGRPVLEAIRAQYPHCRILLTFYSPSGYEVRKNYQGADYVYYLPLDTARNARDFLDIVRPGLVIFIKYEFWYHFLTALSQRQIPVLLISGIFRPDQLFFKPYGGMFRRLLRQFDWIFVQNQDSLDLIRQLGIEKAGLAGDTRFDRVFALLQEPVDLPAIDTFINGRKAVIAGSTWEADEQVLAEWWKDNAKPDRCLILAPHEIHESHIKQVQSLFPGAVRYSAGGQGDVLIIDNIGLLSLLYRYARVTFIGGGFGKDGIHNILEPATYSKPVLFGPVFHKYPEAAALLAAGGGATIADVSALTTEMESLLEDDARWKKTGDAAGRLVADNKGATGKILSYIQEKRFFTKA
ncbi:3-deoxy-D-manno-octulosonic acid transferase [Chitinophaga silvisoli]|uniref:3-deoxy-D-manno-octulosonic acid transferase n=1 Tax=Chitinophaga silvisoli TaxID=2291814 RepID=UPI001F35D9EA|nr:glycosyltransferase N-terminal domain-containing protein [Chitinophaga silvisoli]